MKGVGNAVMYRSKIDIDRHVQEQFEKLGNEHEKKLKGLAIARMYFKVFEFELAKHYVSTFLSINENSTEGRRLLGNCFDKLGNKEKAVAEYQKSLAVTPNQPDLLLMCCDVMSDPSFKLNEAQAEKICKQTENLYPYHPTVYKLKERILTLNGNCDPSKIENLLQDEIASRPEDINLRIKKLKLYESSGRLSEAFSYAINIEKTCKFQKDNVEWYETVSQLCESYEHASPLNWEFYSKVLPIHEHAASLTIIEIKTNKQKSLSECYKVLYRLDQALFKAIQLSSPQTEFYRSLIQHVSNQFYFHLACVIMKSTKKENSLSWHTTNQLAAPLFLMSLAPTFDKQALENITNKDFSLEQKSNVALWTLEGTRRIIESGFVLRAMMAKEDDHFIDNIKLLCVNDWKLANFKKIFNNPGDEYQKTSVFIQYSPDKLVYNIPELIQYALPKHMLSFEMSRPGSLHHIVWYGIQLLESENKECNTRLTKNTVFPVGFGCKSFDELLPLSTTSIASANIESVCQLDLNTFLYATVYSVASFLDNQTQKIVSKAPNTFPSDITDQLTTPEQENWWRSMYKMLSKNVDPKHASQLRKVAVQGLESIRLIGNHGIDVQLMVFLAKNFASQSNKIMDNFILQEGLEKRAVLYWEKAVHLLERINQLGTEHKPKNTLFEFYRKNLIKEEVDELLEEGRLFLACQFMKNGQNDLAIEAFKKLNSPYASYYQAMIYKKMIKSDNEMSTDNILSETGNVFMAKIKDLLCITKERLRKNPQHPLHTQLKKEILDLPTEIDLNGTANSNVFCEEDFGDSINLSRRKAHIKFVDRSLHDTTSTPIKSPCNSARRTVKDESNVKELNELKVAIQTQNVQCQTLGLQYYNMVETMRTMSDKIDKLFDSFNHIKDTLFSSVDTLSTTISTKIDTSNSELSSRIDEMTNNFEKLMNGGMIDWLGNNGYGDEDDREDHADDVNDVLNCSRPLESREWVDNTRDAVHNILGCSHPLESRVWNVDHKDNTVHGHPLELRVPYPMNDDADRIINSSSHEHVSIFPPNPNVNITSSDTLPTGPPVSQPPLSVTIPTHHILSGNVVTSESQPFSSFKFNAQSHSVISHGQPNIQSTPSVGLPLSKESTFNYKFSFPPSSSTFKESLEASLNKSRNSATDDSYTEEHDPIPEFQPIIPLPDKIEEVTGEENDLVLFERRAKLYKYVEKEWKEKGVGVLKILRNNDSNKVRLVMRREQVHKVCANHFIYENMNLKPKGDKAAVWTANDFSDAIQVQVENLCARFKTVEDCDEFVRVFNENKQPCSQNTSLVENSYTSDNYNDSVIETNINSSLTLSKENEKSLKHELGGFTFSTPPIINEIATPKQQEKTPEKPKGLFSNLSFSTSVNGSPSFSSILSKPLSTETKTNSTDKQSFSFNLPKAGLFSTDNTTSNPTEKPLFSFNKTEDKSAVFTPKLDLTSGTSATSYFSTLAKSSPNLGFTNSPDFKGFPGAGSAIFNVKTNPSPHAIIKTAESPNNSSMNQSNEESEDFTPTAEFTPVIPLPEKVNVVTGEEGLEVVFDDRAKLLRFDPTTKEWKERGIGQMKILHHPKENYYQLLMRRELVYKICCNQRLSADLELKPVSSSDKAMSWIGQDFSEGENKKELFAIRFKTVEQLNTFKNKFNEIKNKVPESKEVSISVETDAYEKKSGKAPVEKTLPKLNDLAQFKPKPGSWSCDACYLTNDANTVKCVACATIKPGAVIDEANENKGSAPGLSFGQTSFSSMFNFGTAAANAEPVIPFVMPNFGTSSDITFGSLNSGINAFSAANKTSVSKKPSWREESAGLIKYDSDKSDNDSDENTSETDNDSGRDDDLKCSAENAKTQFNFSNVKIEKPSFSFNNKATTSKSSENQVVSETSKESPTYFGSDNDKDSVTLLDVKSLKDVITPADQALAEELQLPLSFYLYKSKSKCKGCVGCEHVSDTEEDEHEITSSKTDSEKEIERVKEQDEIPVSVLESTDSFVTPTSHLSQSFNNSTSFLFGNKSSPNMFEKSTANAPLFGSKPIFGNISSDSTKTDDTKSTSLFGPSNPSIFGAFSAASSISATGTTESQNTTPQNSLFSKTDDNKSKTEGLFSFSPKTDSPFKFGGLSKDPKSVFGQNLFGVKNTSANENSSGVSVGASPINLNKSVFGQNLFNAKNTSFNEAISEVNPWASPVNLNKSAGETRNGDENGEEEVDNSHDPHFEPIVPLPDAIEVSTGEENETILFCERSKLFRKDGNEYKERGIGEMKILYHPEKNTYRLLFRREKVFKVVCNHLITPDILLMPMKSSNKAFCWACMNTTEDDPEPQKELLAVRFKNEELADKFKQLYDDSVSKLET